MKKNNIFIETLKRIMENSGIRIQEVSQPFDNLETIDIGLTTGNLQHKKILHYLKSVLLSFEYGNIYFFNDIFYCNYIAFYLPDQMTLFIAGPVLYEKISEVHFHELFSKYPHLNAYGISLFEYYSHLTVIPSAFFFENIFIETGKSLYGNNCQIIRANLSEYIEKNIDFKELFHVDNKKFTNIEIIEQYCEMENEFICAVTSGNESLALNIMGKLLKLVSFSSRYSLNQLRENKTYMISLNAILRKAMEKEGIHPAQLGDISTQIEQCTNMEQIYKIGNTLVKTYCQMTKTELYDTFSPLIRKILIYINSNLSLDLSLKTLAGYLNVNASYLSALFSKELGIPLTKYVSQCRINHAKRLLENTNMNIQSIAFQCGFMDTKYFSRIFKQYAGVTPHTYQKMHTQNLT